MQTVVFLILEGGSSLIVDHSILTRKIGTRKYCGNNDCGPFWGGIRIGNKIPGNRVQITFTEGEVNYSYNGIHTASNQNQTSQISLNGTDFYNNRIGINIRSRGFFGGFTNANNCQFEIDSEYPGDHIKSQLQFGNGTATLTNCSVVNQTTYTTPNIAAISQINCGLTMSNCHPIKGYYYGLEALGGGARPYVVKECKFEKAFCNIFSSAVNSFTISNNQFKLKDNYPNSAPGFGIILDKANKFTISGNQFSNSNNIASQSGINIFSTHPSDVNYISKDNSFTNLSNGILTTSSEFFNSLNDNLYLTCNDFVTCVNDIKITSGTSVNIIQRFGSAAAGNTFSQNSNTFQHANYALNRIEYWYRAGVPIERPIRILNVNPIFRNDNLNNPRCFIPPCPPPCNPDNRYHELIVNRNGIIGELNQLLDGGQTFYWISLVQNANSANSLDVYSNLFDLSPNISSNLMISFWQRADLFTVDQKTQLLQANLALMEISSFRNFILDNSSGINPVTLEMLLTNQPPESNRLILEQSLRQKNAELDWIISTTIQDLFTFEGIDTNAVLVWYDRIGSLDAKIDKAMFHIQNFDFFNLQTTLFQIQDMDGLSVYETNERTAFLNLISLLTIVYFDNRYEGNLNSTEIQSLINIAQSGASRTSRKARNILRFYYDIIFEGFQGLIDNSGIAEAKVASEKDDLSNFSKDQSFQLAIYPNPVVDCININCHNLNNLKVAVFDILGKNQALESKIFRNNEIRISTTSWIPGLYFLQIKSDNDVILKTFKFVKK